MAAASVVSNITQFRTAYRNSLQSLYDRIYEKLFVGAFSVLGDYSEENTPSPLKSLDDLVSEFLIWNRAQIGGLRYDETKVVCKKPPILICQEIVDYEFEGDVFEPPVGPNVYILGGGPAGLFMSILLKQTLPTLSVYVIENRVDSSGKRKLTRVANVLFFRKAYYSSAMKSYLEFKELLSSADLASLFLTEGEAETNLLQFLPKDTVFDGARAGIAYFEYLLAAEAQRRGVRIYHDNFDGTTNTDTIVAKIQTRYITPATLAIFDGTGGRFFDNFKGVTPKFEGPKTSVYETAVEPSKFVRDFPGTTIPFIAIGDSLLRADWRKGNGFAINGTMSLFFALQFKKIYNKYVALSSSPTSITRHRRRRHAHRTRRMRRA